MKKSVAAIFAVAGAAVATAGASVTFNLTGNGDTGTINAAAGDVITFEFWVDHDDFSVAGGQLDFLLFGGVGDVTIEGGRDAFASPFQNVASNIPFVYETGDSRVTNTGYANDANYGDWDYVISGERPTQDTINWLDFGALPPAFNPNQWQNVGDHGAMFTFDVEFTGGEMWVEINPRGTFNTYADSNAVATKENSVNNAGRITVVPAPASMALLGLGGLVALRRRR